MASGGRSRRRGHLLERRDQKLGWNKNSKTKVCVLWLCFENSGGGVETLSRFSCTVTSSRPVLSC